MRLTALTERRPHLLLSHTPLTPHLFNFFGHVQMTRQVFVHASPKSFQVLVPHLGSLTGGHTTPDVTGKPLKGVMFDLSHLGVSCQVWGLRCGQCEETLTLVIGLSLRCGVVLCV